MTATQRVVAIIGAGGALGAAVSKQLAGEPATDLMLSDVSAATLDATVAGLGTTDGVGSVETMLADVSDYGAVEAVITRTVERFGRLDVAFNNAGTLGEAGPSTQVSESGWNETIAINLTGSFLGAKHQIAEMVEDGGGSVIFTSTFVGYSFAFPGTAAYAASKSGLIGLTQALAAE